MRRANQRMPVLGNKNLGTSYIVRSGQSVPATRSKDRASPSKFLVRRYHGFGANRRDGGSTRPACIAADQHLCAAPSPSSSRPLFRTTIPDQISVLLLDRSTHMQYLIHTYTTHSWPRWPMPRTPFGFSADAAENWPGLGRPRMHTIIAPRLCSSFVTTTLSAGKSHDLRLRRPWWRREGLHAGGGIWGSQFPMPWTVGQ
jgi:hypothetical protein